MSVATPSQSTPIEALSSNGDALIGMTMLGKTAAALALVITIILVCTALLKRWQTGRFQHAAHLRIVGNTAVGSRERIVVVEIEDTWLVLGVGNGRITKLHERSAPDERPSPPVDEPSPRFAQRFAQALSQRGKNVDDTSNTP